MKQKKIELLLNGEIDEQVASELIYSINKLSKSHHAVLNINSEGGSTYDAMAIAASMRLSSARIDTRIIGACFSAATLVSAAGKSRSMFEASTWMLHPAEMDFSGNAEKVFRDLNQLIDEEKAWFKLLSKYTGVSQHMLEHLSVQEKYLNATKCFEYGIINKIDRG